METPEVRVLNLANMLRTSCLMGNKLGSRSRNTLLEEIKNTKDDLILVLDFRGCCLVDYKFLGGFFFNTLDEGSKFLGRVYFVLVSSEEDDIDSIIRAASWKEGDRELLQEGNVLEKIQELKRYFIACLVDESQCKFIYAGTNEKNLIDLLKYFENTSVSKIDSIRKELNWTAEDAVRHAKELSNRRQLVMVTSEGVTSEGKEGFPEDPEYYSLFFLIKEEIFNGA